MMRNNYLIIGGTTGMGLSGALALKNAGHNVAVLGRNPENLKKALDLLGEQGVGIAGDASDSSAAETLVQLVVEKWGKIDGLYHVAGASGRSKGDGAIHEATDEGIDFTIDINLKSLMYSNRAVIQQFRKQGAGGAILNMASVLGMSPSSKYFSAHTYAATKAAAIGFTRSIAATYAAENIRANVIAPALTDTPMAGRAMSDHEISSFVSSKQPLDGGRPGLAEDLDAAVVYFLTEGSKFVTGQVLAVDGGWCITDGQFKAQS